MPNMIEQPQSAQKLVNCDELLQELFTENARPSVRWLLNQVRARKIPFVRIGRLIFFDVEQVRKAAVNKGRP